MTRILAATVLTAALAFMPAAPVAQGRAGGAGASDQTWLLKPARVFDGESMREGWAVLVRGARIEAVGPATTLAAQGGTVIDLPGTTVMPGLIDAPFPGRRACHGMPRYPAFSSALSAAQIDGEIAPLKSAAQVSSMFARTSVARQYGLKKLGGSFQWFGRW